MGIALVLLTPIVARIFGHALTRHAREVGHFSVLLEFGMILVAGACNGVLIGTGVGLREAGVLLGVVGGGVCGAFACVPFIPPLVISASLAGIHGHARPGTLVDRSDARLALGSIAPSVAFSALLAELTTTSWHQPGFGVRAVALGSVAASLLVLVLELGRFRRARREMDRVDDGVSLVFDVGVGVETVARVRPATNAYRDRDVEHRVLRGNPTLAARLLRRRVLVERLCGRVRILHHARLSRARRALPASAAVLPARDLRSPHHGRDRQARRAARNPCARACGVRVRGPAGARRALAGRDDDGSRAHARNLHPNRA